MSLPDVPFTAPDARGLGISDWQLRALVDRGEVRRILRGVYLASHVGDEPAVRCRAARLVIDPRAVLCDRTAAWIHDVDALAFWETDRPIPIEAVVPPGLAPPRRSSIRSGERTLLPSDVEEIDGLRVTTAQRTALDLGCKLQRHRAMASIDALMRSGGFWPSALRSQLPRFQRRRGVIQLRELIEYADPAAESPGESWLRLAILDAGLPMPVAQFWVEEDGTLVYRLDFAYPKLRVCMEFDGREFHSLPRDRERDERRREWLRSKGWRVIVVRGSDLYKGVRPVWLDELRSAIAEAERSTFRYGHFDVPSEPSRSR